jgi:hypothetical protein
MVEGNVVRLNSKKNKIPKEKKSRARTKIKVKF